MAIKLTEAAANQVKKFREEHQLGEEMFFRVGISGGGCSGFNYSLTFDDQYSESGDSRYDVHGVAVVVDKKSALYLDGVTIDWHQSLEKQGFTFDNPNAVKSCGCGSSFSA
jgi:iron-sulfur cluster assembly accessory protein